MAIRRNRNTNRKRKEEDNSPVPVLLGHVRDEPRDLLAVENDLFTDTRLDEPIGVNQVTVQLET